MLEPIQSEIARLEKELVTMTSETLRALYSGQLSGLKMGLTLLLNHNIFDEKKFFCWGGKMLPVVDTNKVTGKERVKFTIQQIIKNDRIAAGRDTHATFTPYIQGHSIGLESVLSYL
jgi:hypothetical protein